MIYQLYKKQVEAWKEEMVKYKQKLLAAYKTLNHAGFSGTEIEVDHAEYWVKEIEEEFKDFATSSRHKDTIELIEAEIERKRGMKKSTLPNVLDGRQDELFWKRGMDGVRGYNSAIDEDIAYLEEQIKLIKKEL